jgi:hypothetical protein
MKYICSLFITAVLFCTLATAQSLIPALDKSPMDLSSYPANYAGMRAQGKTVDPLVARVIYSRPQKNGRPIFGTLVEYNKVWRLGANENTEIEFFSDVKINDVKLKKGRYTLFAIPTADKWTIIVSKDLNNWGAYMYDMKNDLLRVDVPVQKTTDIAEVFYIYFDKAASGFTLNAGWDDVKVSLPISM